MERPDITKAQALNGIAGIVIIAGVLASPEVGLGETPVWVRLAIAAAIYVAYAASHLFSDAKIRAGRANLAAAQANQATAQLQHLTAKPEGDDRVVTTGKLIVEQH